MPKTPFKHKSPNGHQYFANSHSIPLNQLVRSDNLVGQFKILAEDVHVGIWFDTEYGVLVLRKGLEPYRRINGRSAAIAAREILLNIREGHYHWTMTVTDRLPRLAALLRSYELPEVVL